MGIAQAWLRTVTTVRENDYFIRLAPNEWDGCLWFPRVFPAPPAQ